MTKTKKIIIIIVTVVLLGGFFLWILLPRLAIKKLADTYLDSFDVEGKYFEDYSVTDDSLVTVVNKYISLDIPSELTLVNEEYVEEKGGEGVAVYSNENEEYGDSVMVSNKPDHEEWNLTDVSQTLEAGAEEEFEIAHEQFVKGIESFGNGTPDSYYDTLKCIYLLEHEDQAFWDMNKATAFVALATYRSILVNDQEAIYIYEREDICGILHISRLIKEEYDYSGYSVQFKVYSPDDLDTSYLIMMRAKTLEEIYAVINSVEIIGAA